MVGIRRKALLQNGGRLHVESRVPPFVRQAQRRQRIEAPRVDVGRVGLEQDPHPFVIKPVARELVAVAVQGFDRIEPCCLLGIPRLCAPRFPGRA